MRQSIDTPAGTVTPGTRILIVQMQAETSPSRAFPDGIDHQARALDGREGTVKSIDDAGQLHGDWGGLAVQPENDIIRIIK